VSPEALIDRLERSAKLLRLAAWSQAPSVPRHKPTANTIPTPTIIHKMVLQGGRYSPASLRQQNDEQLQNCHYLYARAFIFPKHSAERWK